MFKTKLEQLINGLDKIPDEFWVPILPSSPSRVIWLLDQEDGTAGSYETSQERIGITKKGNITWGWSSGCSCWSGWDKNDYCPDKTWKDFDVDLDFASKRGREWMDEEEKKKLEPFQEVVNKNLEDFLKLIRTDVTAKEVLETTNAEIRRYLIKRIGYENIKNDVQAEVLHKDGDNELLKFKNGEIYVKVKDSSTEREYLLFVEGNHTTCKSAIAWTFGLKEEEYNPLIET